MNEILIKNRIESLKMNGKPLQNISNLVNFTKNIHAIHHHKSCFKYDCKCQYKFPMLPQNRTSLKETGEIMEWFNWDGTATNGVNRF